MASTVDLRSILNKLSSAEVMDVVTQAVSSNYASLKPGAVYRVIQYNEVLRPMLGTTIGGKDQLDVHGKIMIVVNPCCFCLHRQDYHHLLAQQV